MVIFQWFWWVILPEFWRSFPLYFWCFFCLLSKDFASTSLLLSFSRCLEIQPQKPSLELRTSSQGPSLERTRMRVSEMLVKLQMGCLLMPNLWGIYRVKTLELKGCLQCQHSILRQMCGELVSVARRTKFMRRTFFASSPTFSQMLPFWSFLFFWWFPEL